MLVGTVGKNAFSYPKSVFAVQDCIKIAGLRNDDGYCLDIFGGSGTTGAAAAALDRRFILVDQNPESIAVMRDRFGALGVAVEYL